MTTTKPEIGDTVHYTSHGSRDGTYPSTCRAAIVTEVQPGDYAVASAVLNHAVALAVLNPTGMFFNPNIPWAAYEGDRTPGGTWHHGPHEVAKPCLQVLCPDPVEVGFGPRCTCGPAESSEHG